MNMRECAHTPKFVWRGKEHCGKLDGKVLDYIW